MARPARRRHEFVEVRSAEVMDDIPVIEFVRPILGFPESHRFALVQVDDSGLATLRSLDEADVSFVVVPAVGFFPDYAPEIDDATAAELGAEQAGDVLVLVVLNVGDSLEDTTANLLAPILVTTDRRACQVVLDDGALRVDTPLVA